jgi:hypothetical protein
MHALCNSEASCQLQLLPLLLLLLLLQVAAMHQRLY